MELAAVFGLVEEVHRVRGCASAGREELAAASATLGRLRAWVDGSAADVAARLARCTSFPEADLAAATRTSVRDAGRLLERAGVLEVVPVFAEALDAAKVTGGHVDVLGRTLRGLGPADREGLLARVGGVGRGGRDRHGGGLRSPVAHRGSPVVRGRWDVSSGTPAS